MEGTIKQFLTSDKGQKLMLYDDLNTSSGQSGSPVFKIIGDQYYLVGIQIGYDGNEKCKVAEVITPEIGKWIEAQL